MGGGVQTIFFVVGRLRCYVLIPGEWSKESGNLSPLRNFGKGRVLRSVRKKLAIFCNI